MTVDTLGIERPVTEKPGQPVPLFDDQKSAIEFAEENRQHFLHKRYTIKTVLILEDEKEEAKPEAKGDSSPAEE